MLRVDSGDFVIEQFNGREVRLHTDTSTRMAESFSRGDWIEAKVKDEKTRGMYYLFAI